MTVPPVYIMAASVPFTAIVPVCSSSGDETGRTEKFDASLRFPLPEFFFRC